MHSIKPSTCSATNGYMAVNTSLMVTARRRRALHVEQRRPRLGGVMNAVCRLTATSVPNQVIRGGHCCRCGRRESYLNRIGPTHGRTDQADLDPLEREAEQEGSETMMKASISHLVSMPKMGERLRSIRSSPP